MDNAIARQKLNILQMSIQKAEETSETLYGLRPDIYAIRKAEWSESIKDMRKSINSEALLMFIGPFSSGKSSFVNVLLGEDVLPTASTPCTAVVTEISFTDGGGDRGKIYYRNDPKNGEDIDFYELREIINGPTGAHGEVASYHHVEMILDISEKDSRNQFKPFIDVIRIVDCPGFGSPYFANEDIIVQYIERASFTFWMSPCNKIGGRTTEEYLKLIKKNTTTLIPLITKSDLLPDEDEREKIKEEFYDSLSSFFKAREPHFVSSFQFKEAQKYEQEMNHGDTTAEKKFSELLEKCGINWVLSAMQDCATKRKIDEKKVDSLLSDVREVFKDISTAAGKERTYWESKLKENHWDKTDGRFTELDEIKERTDTWIKSEAKRVSDSFKNDLVQKLMSSLGNSGGKVDTQVIQDCWRQKVESETGNWVKKLTSYYTEYIRQYVPTIENDVNLTAGKFEIVLLGKVGNIIGATLESLRHSGPQSIVTASLGATLLASTAAIGKVAFIGKALAGVALIAGPALIGVAVLPLIPVIVDGVKRKNENDKRKREDDLRHSLDTLNVAPAIEQMLGETHKEIYDYIIKYLNEDIVEPKGKYDTCDKIISDIREEQSKIDTVFPQSSGGKI